MDFHFQASVWVGIAIAKRVVLWLRSRGKSVLSERIALWAYDFTLLAFVFDGVWAFWILRVVLHGRERGVYWLDSLKFYL